MRPLKIAANSTKVVKLIAEIAAASQEQSHGIEQINRAISDMNGLTQHNASGAEELASIMAMFRTNQVSSEILRDRRNPIESSASRGTD